jgi:hypothetical protein
MIFVIFTGQSYQSHIALFSSPIPYSEYFKNMGYIKLHQPVMAKPDLLLQKHQ